MNLRNGTTVGMLRASGSTGTMMNGPALAWLNTSSRISAQASWACDVGPYECKLSSQVLSLALTVVPSEDTIAQKPSGFSFFSSSSSFLTSTPTSLPFSNQHISAILKVLGVHRLELIRTLIGSGNRDGANVGEKGVATDGALRMNLRRRGSTQQTEAAEPPAWRRRTCT